MTSQCPHCGERTPADAKFCPSCGGRLTMSAQRLPERAAAVGRGFSVSSLGLVLLLVAVVAILAVAAALVSAGTGPAPAVATPLQNVSLEDGTESEPNCWTFGGFGENESTWSRTSDAHTGSFAERLDMTAYASGDRKLVTTQDDGACAPTVVGGGVYTVAAWYKTTSAPFFFVYYRDRDGSWVYWATSPALPVSAAWTRGTFTFPALPATATHLSVGLGLTQIGSMTMDDFELIAEG